MKIYKKNPIRILAGGLIALTGGVGFVFQQPLAGAVLVGAGLVPLIIEGLHRVIPTLDLQQDRLIFTPSPLASRIIVPYTKIWDIQEESGEEGMPGTIVLRLSGVDNLRIALSHFTERDRPRVTEALRALQ
jgi:hypothetical protein